MEPADAGDGSTGAYGGSRTSGAGLEAPPDPAFDGRGRVAETVPRRRPTQADREILEAIAGQQAAIEALLVDLVRAPTVLGNEHSGQERMRQAFRELDLDPVDVPMDAQALRAHPGHSPFSWDVEGTSNVVATWPATAEVTAGAPARSLILNGHIDVVSPEPLARWRTTPFGAIREGDWLYGRGAADMKSGLAAIVGAVAGLKGLGLSPGAPVTLESVVEEECTGNGTLQCVIAGHTADAAIVAEPFGAAITTSQVGVLWFKVRVAGVPGHAAEEASRVNAIEKSYVFMRALRGLEAELNASPPPPYDQFSHPITMNIGVIRGGDWASTVPSECVTSYRIALYPGMQIRDLQDRIEATVADAAAGDPELTDHPPEVLYDGFASQGYTLDDDSPLVSGLVGAFARQSGGLPPLVATTGTTDAAMLGLYGGTPAVCFGPYAEQTHGVDERVYLPSVVQTAQVIGLFIRDWCGLRR